MLKYVTAMLILHNAFNMKNNISVKNLIALAAALVFTAVLLFGSGAALRANAAPGPDSAEAPAAGPAADSAAGAANAVAGGAFEVTDFNMNAKIGKDHSYDVTEDVSVSIPTQVQSITFSLPNGNFHMDGIDVENTAHSVSLTSMANTITITDAEKLSAGNHTYRIKYRIQEFEDRGSSSDMFYFTAVPPEWKQPITNVKITASFPDDFPWDDIQCYAGQFGVEDINHRTDFEADEATRTVTIEGENIPENYGITLKAELPDGYWKGALNGGWVLIAIPCIALGILLLLGLLWLLGGRDPKVEKTVETKPLEGIVPAEIGYIFNAEVSIRDILMIIIYFARRGYLSISEYEPKRYRLIRKKDPADEEKYYRNAYNILFEDIYENRALEMEDLGDRLMRVRDEISDDIAAGHASADSSAFTPLSKAFRYIGAGLLVAGLGLINALSYRYKYLPANFVETLAIIGIAAIALYLFLKAVDKRDSQTDERNLLMEVLTASTVAGCAVYVSYSVFSRTGNIMAALVTVLASILSLFFISIMRARGKDNAVLVMRLRRLRDFIYHPDPKALVRNYVEDKDYYYDMLQYALTSGAEESWASYFLSLDVPEPDWYSDDTEGHAFSKLRDELTTIDYAKDLKTFMRTIEAAFEDLMRRRRRR